MPTVHVPKLTFHEELNQDIWDDDWPRFLDRLWEGIDERYDQKISLE